MCQNCSRCRGACGRNRFAGYAYNLPEPPDVGPSWGVSALVTVSAAGPRDTGEHRSLDSVRDGDADARSARVGADTE